MGILKMEAHTEGGLFSWYSSLSPSPKNAPCGPGMTISRPLHLGQSIGAAWFSLGAGTSISPERYDRPALYVGAAAFLRDKDAVPGKS